MVHKINLSFLTLVLKLNDRPIRYLVMKKVLLLSAFIFTSYSLTLAQETESLEPTDLIKSEGLENSQVMEIASWLTDVHGPRLTGSPQLDQASKWVMSKFEEWGLSNIHLDEWGPFGRGWSYDDFSLKVSGENGFPVIAYPKAWSSPIEGTLSADVVLVDIQSQDDFEKYTGKLEGKIVLTEAIREVGPDFDPTAKRKDDATLLRMANAGMSSSGARRTGRRRAANRRFGPLKSAFLFAQKPAAILTTGFKGDEGTVFVSGATVPNDPNAGWLDRKSAYHLDAGDVTPQAVVAAEHYNRIARMIEKGVSVRMDMELSAQYHPDDPMEHNVIGEIKGTDPEVGDEIVMIGAHLDSWHAGTGATDNAAGSAAMMEVMRILTKVYAELGKGPRRTIRIALWTGEEQGLHGSYNYVNNHVAKSERRGMPPTSLLGEHSKISAYYNMDNGTGKIRGVYLQGNPEVREIFGAWLLPFNDMGASTLSIRNTGGTDHLSFDAVGIPGFQFIQDDIAYGTRTHHSNMDLYDNLSEEDLKQAATVIASFAFETSERDEMLPRKKLRMAGQETPGGSN